MALRVWSQLAVASALLIFMLGVVYKFSQINRNGSLSQVLISREVVLQDKTIQADADQGLEVIKKQLLPGLIPPHVHYIWCGQGRWFEFKHYLSIHSAARWIRPDRIVFHYESLPVMDKRHYQQWFDQLKHDQPFFEAIQMSNDQISDFCYGRNRDKQVDTLLAMLSVQGGLYIGESTWMLQFPTSKLLMDFIFGLEPTSLEGFVLLRAGLLDKTVNYSNLLQDNTKKSESSSCVYAQHIVEGATNLQCVIVRGKQYQMFSPMNIWELDDEFGRTVRKLYYGNENFIRPEPSYDELVPNIGHMVWLGGGPMNFVFYLSVLSLLYVMGVETVYIHGDKEPAGPYWPQLRNNTRVKFITRMPPYKIYGGTIEPYYRALMSDIIRVDLMIKYGGIYTDTDAIWVKPLTLKDRGYDAVAAFDWVDWSYPFPDTINFGLSYGKRNAPFWRIFRESMRELHNDVHGFTGVMEPYKLMEQHPNLIRIDPHLQVICYQQKCHPTWVHDYHNMSKNHENMGSIPNWREDVHAFHWTHPDPPEYKDMETLLASNSMFADIGKMVLRKAGIVS